MLKSRIPEITHLSPETGRWNAVYAGTKNGWFEVRGVYPDYFLIKLLEVEHGRMLNALDMNEARKVVLIGENVVDMLFRKENPIGKYIRMGQEMFRVIGTIKHGNGISFHILLKNIRKFPRCIFYIKQRMRNFNSGF